MPWDRFLPKEFHPQLDLGLSTGWAHQPQHKALGMHCLKPRMFSCLQFPPLLLSGGFYSLGKSSSRTEQAQKCGCDFSQEGAPSMAAWPGWDSQVWTEIKIKQKLITTSPEIPGTQHSATLTVDKGTTPSCSDFITTLLVFYSKVHRQLF